MAIKLVVGLGNPGPEYQHTRHNAGAILVAEFARQHNAHLSFENKFSGFTARLLLQGRDVRILLPTTYMNLSGQSVAPLVNFFKFTPDEILVAHDEIDLAPGTVRFKVGGGAGGNNGLKSIIQELGNESGFKRLRIGVGHPGNKAQVANYVLNKAPVAEQQLIDDAISEALRVLPSAITGDWAAAVKDLHTSNSKT